MPTLLRLADDTLWPETEPAGRWRRQCLVAGRYLFALGRELASGELSLRAMSLVYTTMLAIVPTLGFGFGLARLLGYHEDLRPLLEETLGPIGPERAVEITDNIMEFADNINGSVLGALSLGLLLVTVMSMAQKVEGSFNFVWRVDRPRSFARRFSEYVTVMLIGPLAIAIILTLIAWLSSITLEELEAMRPPFSWFARVGDLLPFLMTVCVFAFLYVFIPNTRVRIVPALIGGFAAGVVWAAGGFLFTSIVAASARWQTIYSGFAIVLIAMFWLYLSWLILLLGSQLAFYVQKPYHLRFGRRTRPIDNDARERLSLAVMYLIARDFVRPAHGWTNESLAAALSVPRDALEPIMGALTATELVDETSEQRLIPGRDPHRIRLVDIVASVRGHGRDWIRSRESWNESVDQLVDRIDEAIETELGERTLGELVDAHEAAETASGGQPGY